MPYHPSIIDEMRFQGPMALLETTTTNGNRRQTDHDYGMGYPSRGHNAQN